MRIVFADNTMCYDGSTPEKEPLGGSQSALIYLSRELVKLGHQVIVYNFQPDGPGTHHGVEYRDIRFLTKINDQRADAFISNRDPRLYQAWQGSGLKVLRCQDDWNQPILEPLRFPEVRMNIDYIYCVSQYQKDILCSYLTWPRDKMVVMPNGFYAPHFPKEFPEKIGKRLVYCSTPFRGLEQLLRLFPTIRKAIPDVELHVYSDMKIYQYDKEHDIKRCGHIYEMGKQDGVIMHGSIGQVELASELAKGMILAYPNTFPETSCIAQMEAQAAGCVVVASKLGALPETVGPYGVMIDGEPGTEEFDREFVDHIISLLSDKDSWRAQAGRARNWIYANNSWDHLALEWADRLTSFVKGTK